MPVGVQKPAESSPRSVGVVDAKFAASTEPLGVGVVSASPARNETSVGGALPRTHRYQCFGIVLIFA